MFFLIKLLYFIFILIINYINYKIEKKIKTHIFPLFIFSQSLFNRNISIFKNFNIVQIDIKKTNLY